MGLSMNKKIIFTAILGVPFLVGVVSPTAGDFVTRKESVWSKDLINNSINSYTQLMCLLNKMKAEENVGKDTYLAKVNFTACRSGVVASPTDDWYIYKVKSVADSDGYTAHMWFGEKEKSGVVTSLPYVIYYRIRVPATGSGNFTMETCTATALSGVDCIRKLYVTKNGTEWQIHVNSDMDLESGTYGRYFHFVSNASETSGYGSLKQSGISVSSSSASGKFQVDLDFDYAYDGDDAVIKINKYTQGDPNVQPFDTVYANGNRCVSRSKRSATTTVNHYEVYNADGSRYVLNKPQVPFRIIDATNNFVVDGAAKTISGRIMWDSAVNAQSYYLSVEKSVIVSKLAAGQVLRAQTWLGGVPNYNLGLRLNPDDPNDFQILDVDGRPYQESPALPLRLTINNGLNVGGALFDVADKSIQDLSYMGNGYIHGIPWDSNLQVASYDIKKGANAVGAVDGKDYFIRPMFYSVEPLSITCPSNAATLVGRATTSRALIPASPAYTGPVWPQWVDPRPIIGAVPSAPSQFKYIDGVSQ
jgi:hypothetical protein